MSDPTNLDDLIARFDVAALRTALTEAFHRGVMAERMRVKRALDMDEYEPPEPAPPPASNPEAAPQVDEDGEGDSHRRAPRGLTKEIVDLVLDGERDGLPLEVVQQRAVLMDGRLSPKTVYNQLMRGRGKEYQLVLGKWRLVGARSDVKIIDESTEAFTRVVS